VGLLFQDYALFPHLSVFDNVAFGLVEARWPRPQIEARVRELLALVRLTPHADKRPHELSGGEQQRVALARALAPRPRVLLLDEPLGALDLRLREALLMELKRVLAEEGTTALYVTHDQAEAFALAQRVAVMKEGRIVQTDAPTKLYRRPADAWTARFLGHKNLLDPAAAGVLGLPPGHWLLPPFALRPGEGERARVDEVLFLGPRTGLWLDYKGVRLYWEGPLFPPPAPGETLALFVDLSQAVKVAP
jgi:putative spermidine/putrescine transport system ATP-binding protein